jgi:transposase
MPQGRKIHADVHWIIICLSSLLRKEDISVYTGVSLHSVEKILRYYERHGTIQVQDTGNRGRKKQLRDLDVEESHTFFTLPAMIDIGSTVFAWEYKLTS